MPGEPHLLAVFEDERAARRLVEELAADGVSAAVTHGDGGDYVDSLRAEMREEVEEGVIAPTAGFASTKEMMRGLRLSVPVTAVAGALLLLPLSLVAIDGWSWWQRALLVGAIGAVAGGTFGTIVGAALGMRGPETPSAAQAGVTVRVESADPDVAVRVAQREPIRLDVIAADGTPLGTVSTEDSRDPQSSIERLREQLTQPPRGDWHRVQVAEVQELDDEGGPAR